MKKKMTVIASAGCCGNAEKPESSQDADQLKQIVKEKYGQIAKKSNSSACCGDGMDYSIMADDYTSLEGYDEDADLQLGCGLPTEFAKIKKGDVVVDLGSGAGNDCFVARAETGAAGKVIGVDFTPAMIDKARKNAQKLNFKNVQFVYGDLENIPLEDNCADVVVSNCVFNLVPDKKTAFSEAYRIVKPGGHISISDIVIVGNLPRQLQEDASMYAGCVSGAIQESEYLDIVQQAGFKNIQIQKKKGIELPETILNNYLSAAEIATFNHEIGIFSITVYGEK